MKTFDSSYPQKGFSLIELMIYIVISLVVMTSLYQMLSSNQSTYVSGETKIDVQQNARLVMDEITRQLRMTGYYPENFDDDLGNNLGDTDDITHPIHLATDTAIAIAGNVDGDVDEDGNRISTIVLFCLDGTTVRRMKDSSGDESSYTCADGDVLGENIASLRFSYFDEDDVAIPNPPNAPYLLDGQDQDAVPSFSDMDERDAVRRVVVTITARQEVLRQAPQIYTLTSDVRLRNIN